MAEPLPGGGGQWRAVLESVDKELSQLIRMSKSSTSLVALKYAAKRLSEYKLAAEMDAFLELDMLTTAFVVTYVGLQGGSGSGFSRDSLPENLRGVHDLIVDMRNKRFADNDCRRSSAWRRLRTVADHRLKGARCREWLLSLVLIDVELNTVAVVFNLVEAVAFRRLAPQDRKLGLYESRHSSKKGHARGTWRA